jgi:preprotein translocase subunit SecB
MLSPLELEQYYIKELYFSVKNNFVDRYNEFEESEETAYPRLSANVTDIRNADDPRSWRFELKVESKDEESKEFPYSLRIILVGFFRVRDQYPEERADILARVNGPSLLYSAAREALATATSRSGYPAIVLPSIMFSYTEEKQAQNQPPPAAEEEPKGTGKKATSRKQAKPRKSGNKS